MQVLLCFINITSVHTKLPFGITYKGKSLIFKDGMEKGFWAIVHLMDDDGNILNHIDFKVKFDLECSFKQHSLVIKAIPVALINLVKGLLQYSSLTPVSPTLLLLLTTINF